MSPSSEGNAVVPANNAPNNAPKKTKKKQKAVALRYNLKEDVAPVVIASGYGEIAQRIIDVAEKKGIPVFRDDSAASMMCMLDVGSNVPDELYAVIGGIYAQIMQISAGIIEKK